jgi:glycosyltransferase involved in cell wall biosynthesis
MYDLESVCDAFLSLHRSEGFGLGLAESMFLGKPAVGTNWSGNTDFMDARNSCPVDCTLVTLAEDCGPYKAGQRWADPDVDHAAWYLRKLVDDPAWRRRIAEAGRKTITEEFSPQAVGRSYGKRLDVIFRLLGGERR